MAMEYGVFVLFFNLANNEFPSLGVLFFANESIIFQYFYWPFFLERSRTGFLL